MELNGWTGIERLKRLIGNGVFKNVADLARTMGEANANVRGWVVEDRMPSAAKRLKIDAFLSKYYPVKDDGKNTSVKRKAELIATKLEEALLLMQWFIHNGSEDDRNHLRMVLGTDLSYDIFNAARALLTEKHLERVTAEDKSI